jgi:hypothetical protein
MSGKRISRNAPCPCNSGKKYKNCCYRRDRGSAETQFPIGTVALYGPDDKATTKIAAGVIVADGAEAIIERWVGTGIQENPKVQQEIKEFFTRHGVKSAVVSDGNMGCPHEEGEDSLVGEDCPFCPYWQGRQGSGAVS